jgi:hypothetical protein
MAMAAKRQSTIDNLVCSYVVQGPLLFDLGLGVGRWYTAHRKWVQKKRHGGCGVHFLHGAK